MSSLFDTLNAPAEAAEDAIYAEAFSFAPMKAVPNGDPVADGSRAAINPLTAIFLEPSSELEFSRGAVKVSSQTPKVLVQFSYFGDAKGIRKPDHLTRLRDGVVYEVRSVHPDGITRVLVDLAET